MKIIYLYNVPSRSRRHQERYIRENPKSLHQIRDMAIYYLVRV